MMKFEKADKDLFNILFNNSIVGTITVKRYSITNTIDYYKISYTTKIFGYNFGNTAKNIKDAKLQAERNYNRMIDHLKKYTYYDKNSEQWFRDLVEFQRSAFNK